MRKGIKHCLIQFAILALAISGVLNALEIILKSLLSKVGGNSPEQLPVLTPPLLPVAWLELISQNEISAIAMPSVGENSQIST